MCPNIKEYDATADLTPSDKGIQAAEAAGRRLGQFGEQIGSNLKAIGEQLEQHESQVEISHLARHMSDGEAALAVTWSNITSDPALKDRPDLASTFMEHQVEPFIAEMQSHANTRAGKEYALQTGDRIRQQFWRETAGDQAALTANTVHENTERVGNNATVSVARDPSQVNYDAQAKQILDTADTFSSAIPIRPGEVDRRTEWHGQYIATHMHDLTVARYQSMAGAVTEQVAQTGDAAQSPAYAESKKTYAADLKGADWVKGQEWVELGKGLDAAVDRGMEQFRAKDATQRKAESDDFDAALLPIETSLFRDNGAGGVTMAVTPDALAAVQRAALMPGAKQHPEKIEALLNAMHTATQDAISGKETTTDHSLYMSLSNRIGSTTNPLTKAEVDTARGENKLSDTDYHFLREAASDTKAANPKINQAMTELHRWQEQVKPMIDKSDPLAGSIDQQGSEKFSYFSWDTENKVRQAIASGEDPQAAVQRLTDPRNARGFYSFIPQYQTTNKQGLASVLQMTRPGGVQPTASVPGGVHHDIPLPRLPGESPADYLKRTRQ